MSRHAWVIFKTKAWPKDQREWVSDRDPRGWCVTTTVKSDALHFARRRDAESAFRFLSVPPYFKITRVKL